MDDEPGNNRATKVQQSPKQDDVERTKHTDVVIRNGLGITALMWIGVGIAVHYCAAG